MSATRPAEILRQLEQTGAPDADLLARFAASRDQTAFAELVKRHGALVLGVCRRVTRHPQDAEDAFQAVFLILAQKAGSLRTAALLGNWLYGVAYRVAWRARRAAGRRRAREVTMSNPPDAPASPVSRAASELGEVLDEELAALAACYREAIVLCDLRGASREEAVVALGVPEGTLSSRLANGRRKLAARLTRRGVTLSVGALPLALDDIRAATIVPNELIARTGALVADCAAGTVPRSLAHLLNGGSAVRKTFVIGLVLVAAIGGAVLAARPTPEPLDPPKPPTVVKKTAEQPPSKPKEEPKIAPAKAVAFTTAPKLRHSSDLSVNQARTALWDPTGTHLAVSGRALLPGSSAARLPVVWVVRADAGTRPLDAHLGEGATLIAVNPNGKGIVTDLREHNLISGKHRLNFWGARPPGGGFNERPAALAVQNTVQLEPDETHGYAFSADFKAYRTVVYHRDGTEIKQIEVVEVDAVTGTTGKPLLTLDWGWHALSADGKRLAIIDTDLTKVTVYAVDGGAKVSEHKFAPDAPIELPGGKTFDLQRELVKSVAPTASLVMSPDGRRVLVTRGIGRVVALNADTGEPLPKLDGTGIAQAYPSTQAFTADGRLLAMQMTPYEVQVPKPREPKGGAGAPFPVQRDAPIAIKGGKAVLTVWDTQTGKALKTWQSADGVRAAFCPTKPLLAILEPNGENETRLGFWDFAVEVEKK